MKKIGLIIFCLVILFGCNSKKSTKLNKKDYLTFFKKIKGKGCVSGQFIRWSYNASLEEMKKANELSGQWVGMLGADYYGNFRDSVPSPKGIYQKANQAIKEYYPKNGLVNLSLHINNPQSGASAWDYVIDIDSIFIPNSRVQKNLLKELDFIAEGIADLEEKGVMVMFRPYHEMNGYWFWWGKSKRFAELWKFTYKYLVEEKKLDNMLWCWSPDAGPGNIHDYYPGDEYVDIVGLDSYGADLPKKALDDYKEILKYNKPFGFSEYGCVQGGDKKTAATFDYSVLKDWLHKEFPEAVYFLVWRDHWGFTGKKGVDVLLNDDKILNKESIMELKTIKQ
ncbi:glycosyl hydrolase [Tenacibaculum sp. 190524A02b]|uniref:glycosyl hydrolase n=1 Tax=Tenacibaculum vairaonense TaxID=3137860 RepID=UPI0031FB1540